MLRRKTLKIGTGVIHARCRVTAPTYLRKEPTAEGKHGHAKATAVKSESDFPLRFDRLEPISKLTRYPGKAQATNAPEILHGFNEVSGQA